MKILVIDDKKVNRVSAQQTIAGHDLTIVGNYDEAVRQLDSQEWDVVLTDLLMPAGRDAQGGVGLQYVGQEMPVGFALALLAALRGAKYVAVVTATNHHNHPASAMLDRLGSSYWRDGMRPNFVINGARAMFVHHTPVQVEGLGEGKDWGKVLAALTAG
jgi:CheY-like chemotaxis protein